MNECKTLLRL